jgi:hypothetical protein
MRARQTTLTVQGMTVLKVYSTISLLYDEFNYGGTSTKKLVILTIYLYIETFVSLWVIKSLICHYHFNTCYIKISNGK